MSGVRQRGAALILVLWLVAGLALVVAASARSVSGHVRLAAVELERLQAEAVLDGAIALMAQHLRRAPDGGSAYRVYRLTLGADVVDIEVTPAKGLVDVAVASDRLLETLLHNAGGVSPGEAKILASRIRDWIDTDDRPDGVGGAETAQYRAAGWPVLPRNEGRLEDFSDLMGVLGMSPQVYEKIRNYLGFMGQERIDLATAPPALVDVLTGQPGLGHRLASTPLELKEAAYAPYLATELFRYQPSQQVGPLRLVARWHGVHGQRWEREVWVDRAERPDTLTPWTTLWVEPTRRTRGLEQDINP
ncbi:MAG: hypothetical protein AB1371_08555 [Pseudomonadota bacterium]